MRAEAKLSPINPMIYPGLLIGAQRRFLYDWQNTHRDKARMIIADVARALGLEVADVCSASRKKLLVAARCIAIYKIHSTLILSLSVIGGLIGGLHHSTVIYNLRIYDDRMLYDRFFAQWVETVNDQLTAA